MHRRGLIFVPWVNDLWERSGSLAQTHWHTREASLSLTAAKIMYCGDYFILLSGFRKGKKTNTECVWGLQGAFNMTDERVSRFGIKPSPNLHMKAARLQNSPLLNDMV